MTTTVKIALRTLDTEELNRVARVEGPCITIQVPDIRPGAGAGSRAAYVRQLTQEAEQKLRDLNRPAQTAGLAETLARLAPALDADRGGPGMTLLIGPAMEAAYQTPGIGAERLTIGSRFDILPLVASASAPRLFYILGVSKKHVRLWFYSDGHCEERPLPPGVPPNLEAALDLDKPDHDLENRSAASSTAAGRRRVRFGTSGEQEAAGEYLHHFFGLIAKGLKPVVNSAPIYLIGVHEELAEYRRAAKHNHIFESEWNTNPQLCSPAEVEAHARETAMTEYQRRIQRALESLPEVVEKLIGDPKRILNAAREGRVRGLFVAQGARVPASNMGAEGLYDGEDLLNAVAVETLRTDGEIFMAQGSELPGMNTPIAAILRY
jgi:hypothetical protein